MDVSTLIKEQSLQDLAVVVHDGLAVNVELKQPRQIPQRVHLIHVSLIRIYKN